MRPINSIATKCREYILVRRRMRLAPITTLLFITISGAIVFFSGCSDKGSSKTLQVYAAASLSGAISEIGDEFTAKTAVPISFNFASSGALAQQILASPQADLYFSANEYWMNHLEAKNSILPSTKTNLLQNSLVIVANTQSPYTFNTPTELAQIDELLFAIGDPNSVPAGRYAKQWLETILTTDKDSNLWEHISTRASLAPDAQSIPNQIKAKRNLIGIIYKTDYINNSESLRLLFEIPKEFGQNITYPVAIIANSSHKKDAQTFIDFTKSPTSLSIFEKFGFNTSKLTSN